MELIRMICKVTLATLLIIVSLPFLLIYTVSNKVVHAFLDTAIAIMTNKEV